MTSKMILIYVYVKQYTHRLNLSNIKNKKLIFKPMLDHDNLHRFCLYVKSNVNTVYFC